MRTSPRSLIATAGIGVALLAFAAGCSSDGVTAPVAAPEAPAPEAPALVFTSLELTPSSFKLFTFEPLSLSTVRLSTVAKDQYSTEMVGGATSFSSSDPNVATVDASGLVTAVASGEADIAASVTIKGVTKTATAVISVSAANLGIYADIYVGSAGVRIYTWIFPDVANAVVTVNGVASARFNCGTNEYGCYDGYLSQATSAGSPLNLEVTAGGLTVEATGSVPEAPVLTAPATGAVASVADSVTVTWTSATDPSGFAVLGISDWGWYDLALAEGNARDLKVAAGHIGLGDQGIGVRAINQGSFTGPVDPRSRMEISVYGKGFAAITIRP